MRKRILLYLQVPFMDFNLEYIKMAKTNYDLHILIELPTSQFKSNIFDLNIDSNKYENITSFWNIVSKWNLHYLVDYFNGCCSINFVLYKKFNPIHSS